MKTHIVTPAGRKRYLEVLLPYLQKQKSSFDIWYLWLNTLDKEDILFCKQLEKDHFWIQTIDLTTPWNGNHSIGSFFRYATDSNTIYIRFDDDICYLEDNFISKLKQKRLQNSTAPFIHPIIINNSHIAYILQEYSKISLTETIYKDMLGQNNLWKNPVLAMQMHVDVIEKIKTNKIEDYYIDDYFIEDYCRTSINCISWFGEMMANIQHPILGDEEQFISVIFPQHNKMPNMIAGNVLCSHFAYGTQRSFIDQTNLLEIYKSL